MGKKGGGNMEKKGDKQGKNTGKVRKKIGEK